MSNKIQQAFDNIQANPQLKEATKQFLSAKRSKKNRQKSGLIFALACIALFLTAGIRGYSWMQTPVSYVSIDVNPSMELALNTFDRVISASAYNTEGAEILNGLSLKGKKYTDAIQLIMGDSLIETYLANDPDVVFTVAADKDRESALGAGAADISRHMGHNCHSVCTDMETVSQAHDSGLSLGKYNAYLLLAQYDDTITAEQCRDMSMSEIHKMILEYRQEEYGEDTSKSHHHHGHHE